MFKIFLFRTGLIFLLCLFFSGTRVFSQHGAKYWVQFTDKKGVPFSLNNPEKFLSARSILRRIKNSSELKEEDLPVAVKYSDSIRKTGANVMYTSKWFNSVTIEVSDESVIEKIKMFSFVKKVEKTADPLSYKKIGFNDKNKLEISSISEIFNSNYYGLGLTQISLENGLFLHSNGFRGKGVQIAIIDAGFLDANNLSSLDSARNKGNILGTKDFVEPGGDVYQAHEHGSFVLTSIAALEPYTLVGTAPDASFWLLRSEDANSEYPVEEDNWVAAAEFADSVGADVINTSLGYTQFDDSVFNLAYKDLNGETARISIAASIAASKGIIVVVSAGNEGNSDWHYISAPADAKNITTVGAVMSDSIITQFSSYGPSYDGRTKPDVVAMGQNVTVQIPSGQFGLVSGTSLSSPIIAGLSACLVGAFPNANAGDIISAIKLSGNYLTNPNNTYGYGIPDFQKAYNFLNIKLKENPDIVISPNPFQDNINLHLENANEENIKIECFNLDGYKEFETNKTGNNIYLSSEIQKLPQGLYIFRCNSKTKSWKTKAIKFSEIIK